MFHPSRTSNVQSLRSSFVRDLYAPTTLSLYYFLPDCNPGPRPGTQYYVLLYDSNRHRIRTSETRKRSCCPRNQRQLRWRWAPKGLHGILIQLQQLPSLPPLEMDKKKKKKTYRILAVRARIFPFFFFSFFLFT